MENLLTKINLLEVRTSVLLRQQNTDKVTLLDISFTAPDSFHTFDGGLVTFYSRSCAQRLIWKGFTDLLTDCLDVQRIAVTGFSAVRIVSIPAFLLGTVGRDVDKYTVRVQKRFLYLKSDGNIICHAHLSFPLRDREWNEKSCRSALWMQTSGIPVLSAAVSRSHHSALQSCFPVELRDHPA